MDELKKLLSPENIEVLLGPAIGCEFCGEAATVRVDCAAKLDEIYSCEAHRKKLLSFAQSKWDGEFFGIGNSLEGPFRMKDWIHHRDNELL